MEEKTKVLVIGLDGATWNIIEPLVKEGKLPSIGKLMKNGCFGNLQSCIPHVTFPAWKCYSTGKNPGKLGVYWFFGIDVAKEKVIWHNSTSFKSKELWDILGENDMTCGVLDMPTTYPPKAIKGFMVSHDPPRPSGFVYPQWLEKELKDRFNYKTAPDYYFQLDKDAAIPSTKEVIQQRFAVALYLLKKFDPPFFHLTIYDIDPVQHFYNLEIVEDFWVLIDNGIKSLLDEFCDENTYVILMSDHGHTDKKCTFQMGRWLEERGLMAYKKRRLILQSLLQRLGLNRNNVFSMIGKTRIIPRIRFYIPIGIRVGFGALFPVSQHMPDQNPLEGSIDYSRSKVIPHSADLIYINRTLFHSYKEYEEFRENLIREIKEIEEPRTGTKLAQAVYKREEIYSGRYVDRAPDVVILPNEGYTLANAAGTRETWTYPDRGWYRTHRLQGIFLALGPDIREGVEIEGAKIYDLAPTILHIFGIPIPKDIDGRVLKEIFKEDSALARRQIEYQELDERARVKDRIRGLKALGRI